VYNCGQQHTVLAIFLLIIQSPQLSWCPLEGGRMSLKFNKKERLRH